MVGMYETTCSSSSTPAEADEISMFLHQILLRSSTSSLPSPSIFPHNAKQMESYTAPLQNKQHPVQSSTVYGPDRFSNLGTYFSANVSSSSVGTFDNDTDEYDCESQEGFEVEALGKEAPKVKPTYRNSSKRGRAAEVHNMSEKRRRSRINEKMKALQNLIPNSNKTDKASMLDEAIEYLKQLQLQVQMLTMRNGLSLYPMCLPGALQANQLSQMRMGLYQGNGPSNIGQLPETLTNSLFTMYNQCTSLPNIINTKTSFGLESLAHAQLGPFQLHTSAEGGFDALSPTKEFGVQSNCFSSVRE